MRLLESSSSSSSNGSSELTAEDEDDDEDEDDRMRKSGWGLKFRSAVENSCRRKTPVITGLFIIFSRAAAASAGIVMYNY